MTANLSTQPAVRIYVIPDHVVGECQEESHGEEQEKNDFGGDRPEYVDPTVFSARASRPTAAGASATGTSEFIDGRDVAPLAV